MNPYRHDFQHLIRSKAVIAVVIVTVIAGAVGYLAIASAANTVTLSGAGFWYHSGNAYHVDLWAFDVAGNPVSGVHVDLNVSMVSNGTVPQVTVLFNVTESSDAQGRVQFAVPVAAGVYAASITTAYPLEPSASITGALDAGFELTDAGSGISVPIDTPVNDVNENYYSVADRYLVVWAGPNGTLPAGDRAVQCYFVFTSTNYSTPFPNNCTGQSGATTLSLGSLLEYGTFLPIPATPSISVSFPQVLLQFIEIVNSTGGVLSSSSSGTTCYGFCSPVGAGISGGGSPGPSILSFFATELSFFLPLMALLLTYWSYARPRLTGSLEPVLARPVTRRGLFMVRYGTVALALFGATVAEVLILDLGVTVILREPLPAGYLAPLVGGLAVAAIGFAGLIFLAAHTLRSTGPVLALGITLLLLFSLFWDDLVAVVGLATGVVFNPTAFSDLILRSQLLAPPQFPNVVTGSLTGLTTFGGLGSGYAAAGVTVGVIGLAAGLWILVPLLLTYWRVVTRD